MKIFTEWDTKEAILLLTNDEKAYIDMSIILREYDSKDNELNDSRRLTIEQIFERELVRVLDYHRLANHVTINYVDFSRVVKAFTDINSEG